jgi:hypothetical protein
MSKQPNNEPDQITKLQAEMVEPRLGRGNRDRKYILTDITVV